MSNQIPPKPKPTLPDYHRGYVAGILDSKGLLERLATGVIPTAGLDTSGTIKVQDALDLFQEVLGNLANSMQVKADAARDLAHKMMASPMVGGRG